MRPRPPASMSSSPSPGRVWRSSEEVDTGLCGVLGQDRHHAGRGAEAPGVHADAALPVPEDAHHPLCRDTSCKGGGGGDPADESARETPGQGAVATLSPTTHRPSCCCSSSHPARKRALAASIRTGCWAKEKTSAKLKGPCPVHHPWALAWLRSSGCSAEMSAPMLSWLEMFRAPPAGEEELIFLYHGAPTICQALGEELRVRF